MPNAPFLALITPLSGDAHPEHPIAPGGRPPGIWGGGNEPFPGTGLPGWQPYPDQGLPGQPPRPAHPIAPGGRPPGIWGGGNVPMPTPPIYFPPPGGPPPLGIWGPTDPRPGTGLPGPQPHPDHPIVLPPNLPPALPTGNKIEWKTGWTADTGWVVIGVPNEGTLVPTPSKP